MQNIQHTQSTLAFNAGIAYSDYTKRLVAYCIAALVAFLMSAYFIVGYLVGNIQFWNWGTTEWMNGIVGIGLTFVMTAFQFFLYAQGDKAGGKKATLLAVFVAAGFSLLSEVGQGMERDNIRMESKSLESPTYKAIVGSIHGATSSTYTPYSAELQQAQARLAGCQLKLQRGEVENCVHSQAKVDAVNNMIQMANASKESRVLALASTAKNMERDENNYHPLVNLIRNTLGTTGIIASFALSLTIIVFFEYAFHYLGRRYADARDYLHEHGYDTTRRERRTPRAIHAGANPSPSPVSQPSADGQGVGSVPRARTPSADGGTPTRTPSVLGSQEEQLAMPLGGDDVGQAYREWLHLVQVGAIEPTVRPAKRWISERELVTGIKAIEALANEWLEKAEREGAIKINPVGGIGKPKYILGGAI